MTEQMPQRSFNLHSASSKRRGNSRDVGGYSQAAPSRVQNYNPPEPRPEPRIPVSSGTDYMQSLLEQIKQLQSERDYFANEAHIEKSKNIELESEFHVLRGLINEV